MFLNTIQPAEGATHAKRRVGRGIGSGLGKTGVPVVSTKSVLKAAKCRCNAACPNVVSNH